MVNLGILIITGWPKSKFVISNGSSSELVHISPQVGKAKMCLRSGSFLWLKINFSKKLKKSQVSPKVNKKVYAPGWIRTWDLLHGNPELYLKTMEDDEKWCHFSFIYFKCPKNQLILKKKLPPLKHILALPIWGQICTNVELDPFEITNFDLGHPVIRHFGVGSQ